MAANDGFDIAYYLSWRKFRRAPEDVSVLIPLKDWARKYGYTISGATTAIRTHHLEAYKLSHRWYCRDTPISPLKLR